MSAENSPSKKGSLGIILLTLFISMVGIGIVIPVLPHYAEQFNASEKQIGLLLAVYSACQFVLSPIFGRLSDRIGRKPILLLSTLGSAIGFTLMGAAGSLAMLFVARIIDGVSGANISTGQAYIADLTTRKERGKAMGLMGATLGLGFVFGPAIGGLLSKFSYALPFYTVAVISIINFLLIWLKLPESRSPETAKADHAEPTGAPPRLLDLVDRKVFIGSVLSNFLSVCGFAVMTATWALFLKERLNYGAEPSGYILGFVGVIGILVQGGLVRRLLSKGVPEQKIAVAGALVLCLSLALMPFVSNLTTILIISTGLAVGNSFLSPTISALTSLSAPSAIQGRALGVLQSAGSLGRAVGPALGGWLLVYGAETHYARTALWVSAAFLLVTTFVLLSIRAPRNLG